MYMVNCNKFFIYFPLCTHMYSLSYYINFANLQLMLYAGNDAPEFHVSHSTMGNDIPSIDPFVGGEIHIVPIAVSHTKVNILKFRFFNTC